MSEWQPIETAPKNGTPILLAGGADDHADYGVDKEQYNMKSPCRAWWTEQGWIISLAEAGCVSVMRENPTHWMPLPEPPK